MPFLTVTQAARLRYLVRQAFAENGIEVTGYADYVEDCEKRRFGLTSIAAMCHNDSRGESAWPRIIRDYVERLLGVLHAPNPFDTSSRAELLAATYLRLVAADDHTPGLRPEYSTELAPGLLEVLSLDLRESVKLICDEEVTHFGQTDLRGAGAANLRSVRPDRHERISQGDAHFEVLYGESMFVASLALCLEQVVSKWSPCTLRPELGVFFAVPTRHQLCLHVLRDASCIPSLELLGSFARSGYADGVGAISPDVYWWRPGGRTDRVTCEDADGLHVEVGPALDRVLAHLTN